MFKIFSEYRWMFYAALAAARRIFDHAQVNYPGLNSDCECTHFTSSNNMLLFHRRVCHCWRKYFQVWPQTAMKCSGQPSNRGFLCCYGNLIVEPGPKNPGKTRPMKTHSAFGCEISFRLWKNMYHLYCCTAFATVKTTESTFLTTPWFYRLNEQKTCSQVL